MKIMSTGNGIYILESSYNAGVMAAALKNNLAFQLAKHELLIFNLSSFIMALNAINAPVSTVLPGCHVLLCHIFTIRSLIYFLI